MKFRTLKEINIEHNSPLKFSSLTIGYFPDSFQLNTLNEIYVFGSIQANTYNEYLPLFSLNCVFTQQTDDYYEYNYHHLNVRVISNTTCLTNKPLDFILKSRDSCLPIFPNDKFLLFFQAKVL